MPRHCCSIVIITRMRLYTNIHARTSEHSPTLSYSFTHTRTTRIDTHHIHTVCRPVSQSDIKKMKFARTTGRVGKSLMWPVGGRGGGKRLRRPSHRETQLINARFIRYSGIFVATCKSSSHPWCSINYVTPRRTGIKTI